VSPNDLEKGSPGIPQGTDLPGVLADLPGMFANLPGLFLAFAQKQIAGLRQGFMPFGQSIQAFINGHILILPLPAQERIFGAQRSTLSRGKIKPTHCAV
jgi:hypothetical protein